MLTRGSFALLILAVLSGVFICLAQKNNKLAFAKLFRTEQFLFVSLLGCQLIVEEIPSLNICPYHSVVRMSGLSNHSYCPNLALHLILRDNEVPKVLIFGAKRVFGNLIAQQLRIPWSRQKRPLALYGHVNLENSYNYVGDNLLQKQVIATLLDNNERMLYVLRNVSLTEGYFTLECITFYIQFMPDNRLNFFELNTFRNIHPSNNGRILWTEDPYYRKFYYVEKQADNKIILYSIPFEDIMQTLLDGKPGTPVQMFSNVNLRYLSVSRDIVVIHTFEEGNIKQFITNLYNSSFMITCNMTKLSVLSNPFQAILLFHDELCALKKANGNSNCTITDTDKQYQDYFMHSLFYGIITLIFLLLLVLIQLFVCLYWYRNIIVERSFMGDNYLHVHYFQKLTSDFSSQF